MVTRPFVYMFFFLIHLIHVYGDLQDASCSNGPVHVSNQRLSHPVFTTQQPQFAHFTLEIGRATLPEGLAGGSVVKNSTNTGDTGSVPQWGRLPGGGHGNPLQYSCLENPKDREAWRATVHGVANSLKRLRH